MRTRDPRALVPRLIMVLLLLLGFGRLAQVALHVPLLGYANNYDFIKISSTVGLWVDEVGMDPYEGHPSAPFRHYLSHGIRHRESQYLSSELLFVYPAIAFADAQNFIHGSRVNAFDLRTLGVLKSLCFLAASIFISLLFYRRSAKLGVLSSLIFAVVICDPFNSLYFNTLYFDDSAVIFGYLAVGLGLYLVSTERQSTILTVAFCVALLLLGLSKMQHPGLPLAITTAFCAARARRSWKDGGGRAMMKACAPALAISLLALWLGVINNRAPSMRGMAAAAATDSWFGMTLPALNNVPATLRSLGLPERCEAFVGKNWYTPGMQPPPCPEIFRLHRFQMVWLLLKEPAALWRILKQAIPSTRPFVVFYGQVEGRNFGHIEDEGARFASLGKFFGELASPVYVLLFVTALVGGLLSLLLLMDGRSELCLSFSVFLNAVIVATLIVCLLGDGYADLARHFHIGQSALLIAPVVSL